MKTNEPLGCPQPMRRRQRYPWPREAEKLARQKPRLHPSNLIEQLQKMTGYPRDACWRFVAKFGVQRPTRYRLWTDEEQQKVLEMSETRPVPEIARHFGVTAKSIYHIIAHHHRQVSRRSEWFGLHATARYLTTKPSRLRSWIAAGKLRCVVEQHGNLKYTMIAGAELVRFCKANMAELLRQRIPEKRILFLTDYVVAADVSDDYRARSDKLEREAFKRGEYVKASSDGTNAADSKDEGTDDLDSD
jgi:hypothetical protein